MKKFINVSLLSTMLLFGQPIIAFADTLDSRTINFEDIGTIITEQNIAVRINENNRLSKHASYSDLKKSIKEAQDKLDSIEKKRDNATVSAQIIALGSIKQSLLENIEILERNQFDKPTYEAMADLEAAVEDDAQIQLTETLFINYNQQNLYLSDYALEIKDCENQLRNMQLQESLGMISQSAMNNLKTTIVDLQTKLENVKLQQELYERELKIALNDQENTLVFGSVPNAKIDFVIEDEDVDLKTAIGNSYKIKLQEQKIVLLQSELDRVKEDNGISSNEYKVANYNLTNANLTLSQLKDTLKSDYNSMIDDIVKAQANLRLAEQSLENKKVSMSEAQIRMNLGLISQSDMDSATTDYQAQENVVREKQIDIFNEIRDYEWFLKGMVRS